jgi:cytochrome b561
MAIKNTKNSYGVVTILLHWLMTILVMGLFILGQYMTDLDYYDSWYQLAPWWHKNIGLCVFALLVIRLIWRLINITPESISTYKVWEVKLSKIVHVLFYILLFITCFSGYFVSTAKGVGFEFFAGFEVPSLISLSENNADNFATMHELATHGLLLLFLLHVVAALKHHYINKDITLIRMFKN